MAESRELTMDDYLAMARRRLRVIVVPLLVAPLAGFTTSYLFSPRYTSQSMILVEGQKVPTNYVVPVITADFTDRLATLQQQMLSASRLRPVIQSLGLVKAGEEGKLIEDIRTNMTIAPVITSIGEATQGGGGAKKKGPNPNDEPLPGFYIGYTNSDPGRAQKICSALTSLMVDENLRSRAEYAKGTEDFLSRQVEDAKRALDDQDAKLAAFKKQYMGQLPTDIDTNMRMLATLNTQLDATTQSLNRAQQDRTYAESVLAQQLATWKTSQTTTSNPVALQQQLNTLQTQLLQLQARYTDDYPDVIKVKADIKKVQARLDEVNKPTTPAAAGDHPSNGGDEPAELKQLRLQIHQYQDIITQASADQKKLQAQINIYQSRTAMSPGIEEQWRELTRDYDNAQTFYRDLLAKKSSAGVANNMETEQQGEQMQILTPAQLPDQPSFPVRWMLAGGGLGAGLGLGVLLAIWLEFTDRSIRTAKDIAIVMDLPTLMTVPWLGHDDGGTNGAARRPFWKRPAPPPAEAPKEKVEV